MATLNPQSAAASQQAPAGTAQNPAPGPALAPGAPGAAPGTVPASQAGSPAPSERELVAGHMQHGGLSEEHARAIAARQVARHHHQKRKGG